MVYIFSVEVKGFQRYVRGVFLFGRKGNLIVGGNGSGKSSIASALALALGGNMKTLGKSISTHELIKYKEKRAEITVVIHTGNTRSNTRSDTRSNT
ncbi:hypothetical protein NEFER01_1864, partial [Nematocida sp. LUAm1]